MPAQISLLSFFPQLETISVGQICQWISGTCNTVLLENKLSNQILYPQTIPQTAEELIYDLAILREALKQQPDRFYNVKNHRIFIPEALLERFPDLNSLVWAFIDAVNPVGMTTILLTTNRLGNKPLGTILKIEALGDQGEILLLINQQKYQVSMNKYLTIPTFSNRVDLKFESKNATLEKKNSLVAQIAGGSLGIIVDTRKVNHG